MPEAAPTLSRPLRVVMSGPLPPAIGGMASVIGALSQSELALRTDLTLFNTGKQTSDNRSLWEGIRARLTLMAAWRAWLRQHHADIAHIHTCSGFTFFLDGLLAAIARYQGCRVVLHVHGGLFDQFLDGLNPVLRIAARHIARRTDLVLALSDDWRHRLGQRLPGSRISVLPNGVAAISGQLQRAPGQPTTFLFLGQLSRLKGVHILLDALQQAQTNWRVQLAGSESEPGFTDWLRAEIDHRQLADRMTLLGPLVGEAKNRVLTEADAFVLPSLAEGLPMSLLEAMAARLPVVVTTVGAIPEVIQDGVHGLLVGPGNATALAQAMDHLARSPEQRESMGLASHALYEARYSADAMAQALLSIYKNELGPRHADGAA